MVYRNFIASARDPRRPLTCLARTELCNLGFWLWSWVAQGTLVPTELCGLIFRFWAGNWVRRELLVVTFVDLMTDVELIPALLAPVDLRLMVLMTKETLELVLTLLFNLKRHYNLRGLCRFSVGSRVIDSVFWRELCVLHTTSHLQGSFDSGVAGHLLGFGAQLDCCLLESLPRR